MKTDVITLQDTFKIGYDAYEESREEAAEVLNLFHNRQYTSSQLATLENRGQPAETFNVIKLFGRMLLGYYSSVVNTVKISPRQYNDLLNSQLLNDIISYEMENNHFETEGDKIKLDGLLQGLMCVYVDVKDTEERDQFGRKVRELELSHVPAEEIVLDPMSKLEDYSDARFLHRFKWMSEEMIIKILRGFGKSDKQIQDLIDKLDAYSNHLNVEEADFEYAFQDQFDGYFKKYDNYLIVHSIVEDDDGDVWAVYWCADEELHRYKVTYKEVKFPYRVHKIHTSNKTEFYGIFREIIESQKAINQALIKIQLMVNTQKAFVEEGGVADIDEFTDQFNRVNAVIPVLKLSKIKIENLTREVLDQYTVIDKGFDRIQRVLGINDSFLGMAFASDSGRKVKLQQNATALALRYITVRIEQFYRLLGWDMVNLVKQYYTANQALRITDESVGERWIEINKPLTQWTGQIDPQTGQPIMDLVYEEVLDPASGEPELDEQGNVILAPIPTTETEIAFTKVDISIDSVVYNDEDEKNQLMMENVLQGNIGQALMSVNPAGFFKATSLTIKQMKMRNSPDIAEILANTAAMIAGAGNQMADPNATEQQKQSQELKLPQNTNEGA
jgi:hypothetical protein